MDPLDNTTEASSLYGPGVTTVRNRLSLLLILPLLGQALSAQVTARYYAGISTGKAWLAPKTSGSSWYISNRTSESFQLLTGYRLRNGTSLEAFYSDMGEAALRDRLSDTEDSVDYRAYGVLANWHPFQNGLQKPSRLRWFLQAGISTLSNQSSIKFEKNHRFQVSIGAGIEYEMSDLWHARLSFQSHNRDAKILGFSILRAWGANTKHTPTLRLAPDAIAMPEANNYGVSGATLQCPSISIEMAVNGNVCPALDINFRGLHFASNSAKLDGKSYEILKKVAHHLTLLPDARIEIGAHTDSQGSATENQYLSERRARAVRNYLVEQGISIDRLEYRGYGESNPVANNVTAEGRAKNRRVELLLLPAQDSI